MKIIPTEITTSPIFPSGCGNFPRYAVNMKAHILDFDGEDFRDFIQDGLPLDKYKYPDKAIVRCSHCGQFASRFTACVHCGAPIE